MKNNQTRAELANPAGKIIAARPVATRARSHASTAEAPIGAVIAILSPASWPT